ncbi:hypothetical protein EUGRSUZ_L00578 [Eucalyptus grandis]|uniref:Serine-threonine/tyrosine-protein kinase catalytic domain-containing protein n=1 Tax=Eucalyptus grandis TaxID=71139 RepID=A0A058ZWC8_EUCGR|nr:hypothetical protein EUGRSUZ_L00578 [Eucalyptus grandis]
MNGFDKFEVVFENDGMSISRRYSYAEIKRTMNSFKEKLDQGGYGFVHKGNLLNGRLVAVKILSKLRGDGEEFINEVNSISKPSHVHIVHLLGICFHKTNEFMANGSLEKFIYEENYSKLGHCHLGWDTYARGIVGFIASEVFCRNFGGISYKLDVCSFGMMVLEIVGGRKNIVHLELREELGLQNIVDEGDSEKARKMVIVSLWCIQTNPSNRPTMNEVVDK